MPTKTRRRPAKRIAEALKIQLDITADGLQGLTEQFSFNPEDENLQGLVALAELFDKPGRRCSERQEPIGSGT